MNFNNNNFLDPQLKDIVVQKTIAQQYLEPKLSDSPDFAQTKQRQVSAIPLKLLPVSSRPSSPNPPVASFQVPHHTHH